MRRIPVLLIALSVGVSAWLVPAAAQTEPTGSYIVVLNDEVAKPASVAKALGNTHGFKARFVYKHALKGFAAVLSPPALAAIEADPRVLSVEEESTLRLAQTQPPQVLRNPLKRIDADQSSTLSGNGSGSVDIDVAVLDTGIDPNHPDLNVAGGVSCTGKKREGFTDPQGHGTMVGGLIGALDNEIGVVGVAPGARLWAVRVVTNQQRGFISNGALLCGIDWVTGTRLDADPTNDIEIANMSLGAEMQGPLGTCESTKNPTYKSICGAAAAGVALVASAGNESQDLGGVVPATFSEVLAVTAITDLDGEPGGLQPPTAPCPSEINALEPIADDTAVFFSNFATAPDDQAHVVAAPGVCITTTFPGGLYAFDSGTSFSAPIVSGVVALCIASGPCAGMTPNQIVAKIVSDAAAYNNANPSYGFGGDPNHPISGKYYGYLVRAGLY